MISCPNDPLSRRYTGAFLIKLLEIPDYLKTSQYRQSSYLEMLYYTLVSYMNHWTISVTDMISISFQKSSS